MRLSDWPERFQQVINEHENIPFEYGVNDCAIFSGKILEALTGHDFYSSFIGRYKTKIGGFRQFRKATGHKSHVHFIKAKFEEVPVAFAQVGDLAILNSEDGPAVVVIAGQFAIGLNNIGLVRFPIEQVSNAYRVEGV